LSGAISLFNSFLELTPRNFGLPELITEPDEVSTPRITLPKVDEVPKEIQQPQNQAGFRLANLDRYFTMDEQGQQVRKQL
jgi:hypothetical protein